MIKDVRGIKQNQLMDTTMIRWNLTSDVQVKCSQTLSLPHREEIKKLLSKDPQLKYIS